MSVTPNIQDQYLANLLWAAAGILLVVAIALLFEQRLRRIMPHVTVTWGDPSPAIASEAISSAIESPPPFRVGLAPDGLPWQSIRPAPAEAQEPYHRTQPFDVDILVTYTGQASAREVSYFYVLDPEAEGHPDGDQEPSYQRLPATAKLCASFTAPLHHDGITAKHTLRLSMPWDYACRPIWVSIHSQDRPKIEAVLHLHMSPGFPHVISNFRADANRQCRA